MLSDASQLETILRWLEDLYDPSIPRSVWLEIQTAVGEGFDNAVRHAHRNLPASMPVELEVVLSRGLITLRIWDCGPGFDFDALMVTLPDHVSVHAESGRGFCILRKVADRLSYTLEPDNRHCLLLEKRYIPLSQVQDLPRSGSADNLGTSFLNCVLCGVWDF